MTAHRAALDLLDPRMSLVHGAWLTDGDLDLLGRSRAMLQRNPLGTLRLGSGIASIAHAGDRGVMVTLGSGGVGSTVSNSMTAVVRAGGLLGGLRDDTNDWLHAAEALDMATSEAAAALGIGDLAGRIAPGLRVDLVGIRLDDSAFTPLNDPLRQLVYASRSPIDTVVVDGRLVVEPAGY